MAESSSRDLINKSIQKSINSQESLVPEGRINNQELHNVNLTIPSEQVDDLGQETNFPNSSQIEVVSEGKEEETLGNLKTKEKKEDKKEKRPRRRRGRKEVGLVHDFERLTVCDCDKRGDSARVVYRKEEMEDLRYLDVDEQKKKWIEVYCRLGPVVTKEYDALVGFKDDDHDENYVNFDPRPQFSNKKTDFHGNASDNVGNEMQNMNHVGGGDLGGSIGGEEDYCEDEEDSDSEEHVSIQRPAFLVTGEPDFESGPPQDGLEYLRRVRWEAEHIPKVKVVKVERNALNNEQTVYMPNIPDIAACPEHLMPSKEWEDVFLADFSKLRLALSQEESFASTFPGKFELVVENVIQENLDFGQTDDGAATIQENLDFCQLEDQTTICDWPSLRTILDMEPVARVIMLRKRITSVETMSSLTRTDCAWLFALCAAIDTPVDGDTSASLRCLLRKCAALRAEKSSLDDEVIMLNILVTISGKYFGQLETN